MVVIFGTLPPPIHGISIINLKMSKLLNLEGIETELIDTSTASISRTWSARLPRIGKLFAAWMKLLMLSSQHDTLYMSLAGGWGQLYDLVTLAVSRLRGMKCFLHHHSTAYLVQKNFLTKILFSVAGKDAFHVVLCEKMTGLLVVNYACQNILQLSNFVFLPVEKYHTEKKRLGTVGYLSNITREKGGWEVVELAKRFYKEGSPLHFLVAGPCIESDLTHALTHAAAEGILEWRGAVDGKEKENFWGSIDAFVFPTIYRHEADPMVLWEALSHGVPVIAYDRGCIAGVVGTSGVTISQEDNFVDKATEILNYWLANNSEFQKHCRNTWRQNAQMSENIISQWNHLVNKIKHAGRCNNSQSKSRDYLQ